jgi:enediyne biosynthesis protein E4
MFSNVSRRVGSALQLEQVGRGAAEGDLFNDGRIDAVVENLGRTDDPASRRRAG